MARRKDSVDPSNETALIVIPEEAELLIPMIRAQETPKVHIMTYSAPVTRNMLHFNGLLYYVIPSLPIHYAVPDWLSIELGIFAGRLYMNFAEWAAVKRYLRHGGNFTVENLRRKGHDITHTPMGYVCQRRLLHQNHPFFATRSAEVGDAVMALAGRQGIDGNLGDSEEKEEDTDLEDEWDLISQTKSV